MSGRAAEGTSDTSFSRRCRPGAVPGQGSSESDEKIINRREVSGTQTLYSKDRPKAWNVGPIQAACRRHRLRAWLTV
jgi:hypothetical protein